MNCPNCGAKNEAEARFCAECGTPLESQVDEVVAEDDDRTIMSSVKQISEEAKTVSVSQADLADLSADMAQAEDAEFETETPAPPSGGATGSGGGSSQGGGLFTQRNIIIAVVVLLILCCCCALLAGIGAWLYQTNQTNLSFVLPVLQSLI
jgi:hypothetical protein